MTDDEFIAMLKRHEGVVKTVYKDSRGYDTIGAGFLVDKRVKGAGLTDEEINAVLKIRVGSYVDELDRQVPWWRTLTPTRQAVLADMAYNLGVPGLLKFKNTLAMVKSGDYDGAAKGMLNSLWAKQVKGRATELADLMRQG